MDLVELGTVVRKRRQALGLTQLELAELAGVGTRFIHEIETGSANPRLRGLLDVCTALGLDLTIVAR
jgi:y4mF family transcriptional regulator